MHQHFHKWNLQQYQEYQQQIRFLLMTFQHFYKLMLVALLQLQHKPFVVLDVFQYHLNLKELLLLRCILCR